MFTDTGRVHQIKAYRVPEAGRTAKGSNIVNIIDVTPEEKITAMFSVPDLKDTTLIDEYDDRNYLTMITRRGVIKRTRLAEFRIQRKGGKIALNLDDGDKLIFVGLTHGESDIMIATRKGLAARFNEDKVTVMGRSARGVRGISLRPGDEVAGACIIERGDEWAGENFLVTISEGGFGKRMSPNEFEAKGRGIQGMILQKLSEKTGDVCGIAVVKENEDLLMITNDGTMIRTPAADIPVYGRSAAGVIVMRLNGDKKIANFALVESAEDEEELLEGEEAEEIEEIEESAEITEEAEAVENE